MKNLTTGPTPGLRRSAIGSLVVLGSTVALAAAGLAAGPGPLLAQDDVVTRDSVVIRHLEGDRYEPATFLKSELFATSGPSHLRDRSDILPAFTAPHPDGCTPQFPGRNLGVVREADGLTGAHLLELGCVLPPAGPPLGAPPTTAAVAAPIPAEPASSPTATRRPPRMCRRRHRRSRRLTGLASWGRPSCSNRGAWSSVPTDPPTTTGPCF